jgi:hypothetical protein
MGDTRPPAFTIFTITYKVAVYAPAERADKNPLFHLYPYGVYALTPKNAPPPSLNALRAWYNQLLTHFVVAGKKSMAD